MHPITFRPIAAEDTEFLQQVYSSTRAEEMAMVPWTQEQKVAFCQMQYRAQHDHYQKHYPHASYQVIEMDGKAVGRLYVDRAETDMLVLDITLLPEFRGRGLGEGILRDLQKEAASTRKSLSIHVEKFNRALRLYQRLGFVEKQDAGVYILMEWGSEASGA